MCQRWVRSATYPRRRSTRRRLGQRCRLWGALQWCAARGGVCGEAIGRLASRHTSLRASLSLTCFTRSTSLACRCGVQNGVRAREGGGGDLFSPPSLPSHSPPRAPTSLSRTLSPPSPRSLLPPPRASLSLSLSRVYCTVDPFHAARAAAVDVHVVGNSGQFLLHRDDLLDRNGRRRSH